MPATTKTLSWLFLIPPLRFALHALQWLVPPVGFVCWRMRVSKRRHAELVRAARA